MLPLRVLLCQSLRQLLTVLLFRRLTLLGGLLYLTKERRCSAECVCERRGGEGGREGRVSIAPALSAPMMALLECLIKPLLVYYPESRRWQGWRPFGFGTRCLMKYSER